jgi:hypothetical protein
VHVGGSHVHVARGHDFRHFGGRWAGGYGGYGGLYGACYPYGGVYPYCDWPQ